MNGKMKFSQFKQLRKYVNLRTIFVANFTILLVNLYFAVMSIRDGVWPLERYFQPGMTSQDKRLVVQTLQRLVDVVERNNITYMMDSGTLLGSYRHHGFIPWDDDVDLLFNASEKGRLRDVLRSLRPNYDVYIPGNDDLSGTTQWKFYSNQNAKLIHMPFTPFKWPYIDLFFFQENSTHILNEAFCCTGDKFAKTDVFPLARRPFEGLSLYAPCRTKAILEFKFTNLFLCRSRQFIHSLEIPMFTFATKDVPCIRLHHVFPFVHRTISNEQIREELRIGQWSIHNHSKSAICD